MAQKDKVKELVGRGLNSYHTKALQQIDRIEKKNKEQNHKISILSNELDNDYLTKTEEGSVISLEHSKEGMVYLDELQGNTLVNYCTDGSKELTLNGDIDVEGTFVTTTEGVDNGKVDVMCEGNTLVNLVGKMRSNTQTYYTIDENYITILDSETDHRQGYYTLSGGQLNLIKPNTTYTIIAEITKNTLQRNFTLINNYQANQGDLTSDGVIVPIGFVGRYVGKFTTLSDFTNRDRLGFSAGKGNRGEITLRNNFIILEGDWTNRELPTSYFEGMKSVGQDDENGHKIEILSRNKNLFDRTKLNHGEFVTFNNVECFRYLDGNNQNYVYKDTFKKNTSYTYTLKAYRSDEYNNDTYVYKVLFDYTDGTRDTYYATPNNIHSFTSNGSKTLEFIRGGWHYGQYVYIDLSTVQLEEQNSATSYDEPKLNKKEILINEPLVGNSTVKDKVVKIGGKWFVEKLWKTVTLDGTQEIIKGGWDVPIFSYNVPNTEGEPTNFPNTLMCDRINPQSFNLSDNTHWALYTGKDTVASKRYIRIQIPASIVAKDDLEGFKTWLRNNPVTIAYRLNTPIYEPLEIEPTLNTYNDVTHISNNSIIPCNMKIKNTGYNAIIKPSTLYTVALDTNKSGTIGVNLGGAKGTTTNNVLTLTTPATLTDDSLRIYGKGIKGSKVRLLEGDKTNWIPSHFEGMKSSFEDKFDTTDNTYKMEILMNNKNLFDANCFKDLSKWNVCMGSSSWKYYPIYIGKNKKAYMKRVYKDNLSDYPMVIVSKDKDYGMNIGGWMPIIHGNVTEKVYKGYILPDANGFIYLLTAHTDYNKLVATIENCIISTVDVDYIEQKSNKIQFSSIEPLRGVGNYKDKFIFKDNKLMIERNCRQVNMSELNFAGDTSNVMKCLYIHKSKPMAISNIFSNSRSYESATKGQMYVQERGGGLTYLWIPTDSMSREEFTRFLNEKNATIVYVMSEPTYEEVPFELQKIILEGYENGTLFFDTNIPPTSTVTYAGETPIVKATKLNKTEVLNNTNDINDNIIPYLMDMDYRVVCLQLATEEIEGGVSMARLFGGAYEMLKRDILSKRLSRQEYGYRLADYFNAGKLTEEQVRELEDLR